MNPLTLLPLLVVGCVAAPTELLPAGTQLIHNLPAAQLALNPLQVQAHSLVAPAAIVPAAVAPTLVFSEAEADVKQEQVSLPVSLPAVAPAAVIPPTFAAVPAGVPAVPAVLSPAAITTSNVRLDVPAPVPAGEAPAPEVLVQRIPVKAAGRPVVSYTPQVTEVRPELKVIEKTYDVSVPKPVYETQEVTPVQHKFVPEPFAVPQPVAVPQPYAVPQPFAVPVPVQETVHVQHHVAAAPAQYVASAPVAAANFANGPVVAGATVLNAPVASGATFLNAPVASGATVLNTPVASGATFLNTPVASGATFLNAPVASGAAVLNAAVAPGFLHQNPSLPVLTS